MIDLRPEVAAFAEVMERKLRENDHKDHWRYCTGTYLFNRLRGEVNELARAKTADERLAEAADVANFAMMIADNAKRRQAAPKPENGK
jgi:NTP pyrophosphatase (non-canonical NTP hydrolase)